MAGFRPREKRKEKSRGRKARKKRDSYYGKREKRKSRGRKARRKRNSYHGKREKRNRVVEKRGGRGIVTTGKEKREIAW